MPEGFGTQIKALNQRLSVNQKLSVLALGTVILVSILSFVYLLHRQPYQLLFSNLDAQNASLVVEKLKQMNVSYEVADGGKSVLVPADRLDQARMEIVSQGLPEQGRIGFEIFDQNSWGITDFAEKVNYRRALEGELERTILSLSEVSHARVHLVMAKDSLFEDEKQPAKASVAIRLRPSASLAHNRVSGIQNLVAFAVEGLMPEKVTIVDVNGNLLSQPGTEESLLSGTQLEYRRKLEKELSSKVVSLLEPLVGPEKVRVTASVLLDYTETHQTDEIYDPNGSVVLSRQTSQESLEGSGAAGVPFKANDAASAPVSTSAQTAPGSRQTEMVNYEVSRTIREVTLPKGEIKRVSMAVVIDNKIVAIRDGQEVSQESQPRTQEEMERLRNLVSATIGFNPDRGDSLTIENISFTEQAPEPLPVGDETFFEKNRDLVQPSFRYVMIFALFFLFWFLIFRPVKKRVFSYIEVDEPDYARLVEAAGDSDVAHTSRRRGQRPAQIQPGNPLALQAGEGAAQASADSQAMRKQLSTLSKEDPEAVTQVIKSWLSEGA